MSQVDFGMKNPVFSFKAIPKTLTSLHHTYLLSEKSNCYMLHPKKSIFLLVSKGVDRMLKKSHASKGDY